MSATVTCGKRVGAFRNPRNGEVVYVLYESTYEKNCYPHTPHEEGSSFGNLQTTMKRIFACASACEGGGLQSPHGYIKPENYIRGWLQALENPVPMIPETVVILTFDGFYSLPSDKRDSILAVLRQVGDHDAADRMEQGERVRRQIQSESVIAVMDLGIMAWCISLSLNGLGSDEELGYHPTPRGASPIKVPEFAKVVTNDKYRNEIAFQKTGDGWISNRDWVDSFVRNLYANEIDYPGTYRNLIRQYREACSNAPVIGGAAVVQFLPYSEEGVGQFYVDEMERVMLAVVLDGKTELPLATVIKALAQATDTNDAYHFRSCAEHGLIRIQTPNGSADIQHQVEEEGPKFEVLKPKPGIVVRYGEVDYKLIAPAGARLGWNVVRVSDQVAFRMKSKQVADALNDMAILAHRAAKEMLNTMSNQTAVMHLQDKLF